MRKPQSDELTSLLTPILPSDCSINRINHLADLWAGYGSIYRIHTSKSNTEDATYIVKTIAPPHSSAGDEEYDEGHVRKMLSYRIEANFYRDWAGQLGRPADGCCIPKLLASSEEGEQVQTLVMEDLSIRFPILTERRGTLSDKQVEKALQWLASFHASSWDIESYSSTSSFCPPPSESSNWAGKGLWRIGGYHYLATRLDELSSISATSTWGKLGLHAGSDLPAAVEWCLNNPSRRSSLSLIHGDVKAANMAFSRDTASMAMYDFQYVGVGLGVQDLAKFLTTSIPSHRLRDQKGEETLLKMYHGELVKRLPKEADYQFDELMQDWELALVSWVRFLAGWSGGFWGNVDWLTGRVEALLKDQDWVNRVRQRYKSRSHQQS